LNSNNWEKAYALLPDLLSGLLTGVTSTIIITLGGLVLAIGLGLVFAVCNALPYAQSPRFMWKCSVPSRC
jgi:ABC-type amino acid transport system permease subunit